MIKNKELVLITGGAGFIGSHLADALVKDGYRVRVLDNLKPPTHNGKLPDWFNKKTQFIKGDVRNKKDWVKALKGVDFVFHLAAYMDYHLDFGTYFDANAKSTALLYEIILENKLPIKKVVVASSQSLYGEGKYKCSRHGIFYAGPRPENQLMQHMWEVKCPVDGREAALLAEKETDETHPQIPYGISKLAAEKTCLALGKIYNIPSVALRFSIVQGSRQSFRHFYSGALRDFSVRALTGRTIVMQEDANQIRDFVNVHDVISAHLTVLKNKKADFEVFNVGIGKKTKVRDLAKIVCRLAKVPFKPIISGMFRINAPRHSLMDISKLKKLGWRPIHSLEDSVKEYLDWVRNYPEAISYWDKTYKKMEREKILKT
ncbi:MAG: NAD-dependent epimerase/dehydratase family protein [Parcubacteria group bacterium]|nr:NAD-dependent epimerase/dehydratase family protein [Parcubacteria group bacterium]